MEEYFIDEMSGFTYDNEIIYFMPVYMSALLSYDCNNKEVRILAHYPEEVQMEGAFEKIVKYDNKVFLFPRFAKDIYYFDLEIRQFQKMNILHDIVNEMPRRKVFDVIIHEEKIYGVCRCPSMIICIDPKTDETQICRIPLKKLGICKEVENVFFSVSIKENEILIPYADNSVIQFDVKRKKFEIVWFNNHANDDPNKYIMGICADSRGLYWIYNASGELFKIIKKVKTEIDMPKDFVGIYNDGLHDQPGINNMFLHDDELCFFLRAEHRALKYNIYTGDFIWQVNNLAKWDNMSRKIASFYFTQVDKDTYWINNKNDNAIYKWNIHQGFIERTRIKIPFDTFIRDQIGKQYLCRLIARENNLNSFIELLGYESDEEKQKKSINYGEKIHQKCIS